jgi:hypothetical protein
MPVTAADISDSIVRRLPLDFSYLVLGHPASKNLFCPPVVKAFAEEEPHDKPNDRYLTLEEFEALSLAARVHRLMPTHRFDPGEPVWAHNAIKMQPVSADVIREGIRDAARYLEQNDPCDDRVGLHLIGAAIEGDIDLTNLNLPFSIRLIGCSIDGAVRVGRTNLVTLDLSGSVLRGVFGSFVETKGSVRLRRLMSTSVIDFGGAKVSDVFDASDAVVFPLDDPPPFEAFVGDRGIFNLSLSKLSNEARFMRARIYGGLTLKGASIERSLFLDDAVLRAPLAFLERIGADVAEKTHQAVVDDLPLIVLTSWRAEERIARELHRREDCQTRRAIETLTDFPMARELGLRDAAGCRLFPRLLMESPRARGTCLRGDGLDVTGSIFARSVRSSGRMRCNYIRVGGTVHLDGVRMRSSQDIAVGIQRTLDAFKKHCAQTARQSTWDGYVAFAERQLAIRERDIRNPDAPESDKDVDLEAGEFAPPRRSTLKRERAADENFALRMRGCEIRGNVDLKPDNRAAMWHDRDEDLGNRVSRILKASCRCVEFNKHTCGEIDEKCVCAWRETNNGRPQRPNRREQREVECYCGALNDTWEQRKKKKWAHVHNAYVNGQLVLEGALIHGDLNLTGILANLHGAQKYDPTRAYEKRGAFLRIERAVIHGSLDFNDSIGVRGLEAQHVHIGARLRFARHSVRIGDVDEAALLVSGKLQLSDARIGGDATFLFDKNEGPSLLLARARIDGRLTILPAKQPPVQPTHRYKRRKLENATIKSMVQGVPEIDLRSARAVEIGHMEAAWPRQDYLRLEGFTYDQASVHGPLSPRWRGPTEAPYEDDSPSSAMEQPVNPPPKNRMDGIWNEPLWFWLVASAIGVTVLVTIAAMRGWLDAINSVAGLSNVSILLAGAAFWIARAAVARYSNPKRYEAEPRAIYWLGLQRASTSVYQVRGLTIPLQPYVQAGKVLRAAGLILSANLLEVDRLSRRNEQLSWRNNWPAKILLSVANSSTKYGFDPLRTIVIAVVIGAFAACIFHAADRGGFIRPTDGDMIALVDREGDLFKGMVCDAAPIGCAARAPPQYPTFSSTLFAFDVMTPGLDIGQEQYWRSSAVSVEGSGRRSWLFAVSASILKIIGWLLTTAIAISLLTRVEAMIARHEE